MPFAVLRMDEGTVGQNHLTLAAESLPEIDHNDYPCAPASGRLAGRPRAGYARRAAGGERAGGGGEGGWGLRELRGSLHLSPQSPIQGSVSGQRKT